MQLSEITYPDARPIDGYGPGFFRVGGAVMQGPVTVLPGGVAGWAGYDDSAPLIAAVSDLDVLLIGTGAEIAPVPAAFRAALEGAGIGVEPMASPAACRTFNMLLAEGRRVGAALIPV
jgi:uncharacterized protein